MKLEGKLIMKAAFFLLVVAALMYACSGANRYFNLDDDHIAEEATEMWIESKTGYDIDLTPSSKER